MTEFLLSKSSEGGMVGSKGALEELALAADDVKMVVVFVVVAVLVVEDAVVVVVESVVVVVGVVEVEVLKRKLMSLSHGQELGQLADLPSDCLFTLVQPIRSQLSC